MGKNCIDHETATINSLQKHPAFQVEYLKAVIEDGNYSEIMIALRRASESFGGVPAVATQTGLNEKTLYRTLSPKGNPSLKSFLAILSALNLKLSVMPKT